MIATKTNWMLVNKRLEFHRERYNSFDVGHRRDHCTAVERQADVLVTNHKDALCEVNIMGRGEANVELLHGMIHKVVRVGAVYHDIGLRGALSDPEIREQHHNIGADAFLEEKQLFSFLPRFIVMDIAGCIRQHRSKGGCPATFMQRVIADADATPVNTSTALMRAYEHIKRAYSEATEMEQYRKVREYLCGKYRQGGSGSRTFFRETAEAIEEHIEPIFTMSIAKIEDKLNAWYDEHRAQLHLQQAL